MTPSICFVACAETGMLAAQARLLFASLRRFGGRLASAPCYALSPRPGYSLGPRTRGAFDALNVEYLDEPINTRCTHYGSANRVAAAGYIEARTDADIIVVLDSDTLFLREPLELLLPTQVDVAVRPVDVKGMCTSGPGDPHDAYWRELCESSGVAYDSIPQVETTVDRVSVKASYNGGLVVARRSAGVLQRWCEIFFASVERGLRPYKDGLSLRSGMGIVAPATGQLWGSNQAALSLAIWSRTTAVALLSATYNVPLHVPMPGEQWASLAGRIVHAHYHWLCEPDELQSNPLLHEPTAPEARSWLKARLPLEPMID